MDYNNFPVSRSCGPTGDPRCPGCENSLGNVTPTDLPNNFYCCANCKEVFRTSLPFPVSLEYSTCDEVAECTDGLTKETYLELWDHVGKGNNVQRVGGDGSPDYLGRPTLEWPEPSSEYSDGIKNCWGKLSYSAQKNITEALIAQEEKDKIAMEKWRNSQNAR